VFVDHRARRPDCIFGLLTKTSPFASRAVTSQYDVRIDTLADHGDLRSIRGHSV
jgi:hypothetical protein